MKSPRKSLLIIFLTIVGQSVCGQVDTITSLGRTHMAVMLDNSNFGRIDNELTLISKSPFGKNDFGLFDCNDTLIGVDTLVVADEWGIKEYSKKKTNKGYLESKIFHFKGIHIEITQCFVERKGVFKNRVVKVDGRDCRIEHLYKKIYRSRIDKNSYVMGNLVTAKKFEGYILIDLVIAQNNCLGEFCNDVEILTLKFLPNGTFTEAYFHDEDFSTYSL